jgi:diguanylate cyclase (GGDEF)-like protein
MYKLLTKMENIPLWVMTILIPVLIFIVAMADYETGYEVAFSIFYLLPVTLTAFFFKREYGIFIAAVCSLLWGYINQTSGQTYSNHYILYWNDFTRFAYFAFTVIIFCDLHDAIHKERELSMIDPLTGIFNRRMFYSEITRQLAQLKRYKRPFCVVYIDMDKFKSVNDTLGHAVGDQVIETTAKSLKQQTRDTDVIARLGGDEFGIIMPETNGAQAEIVLSRLRERLNTNMGDRGWPVTASMGVNVVENVTTLDEIIDSADQLMFKVKKAGGNNILFNHPQAAE